MSYLDLPRVIFAGEFQADVSTVNNDVLNFDVDTFDPATSDLAWNPTGSGAFRLLNCRVRGAWGEEGVADPADPVLGAQVGDSTDRVGAKIVDLDPQWQLSSQLWGLRVELRVDGELILGGDFEPAAFRDLWFPPPSGTQRPRPSARFQSVLHNVVWGRTGVSGVADQLRTATIGGQLSIRLTTFAYFNSDGASPRFTIGSVVGAIGPYQLGEPKRFLAGRRFAPIVDKSGANTAGINFFDGQLNSAGDRLVVDLANALPVLDEKGTFIDQGDLCLGVLTDPETDQGARVADGTGFIALGDPLPYREPGWLLDTAGLVTVPVAPSVDVVSRPLVLLRATGAEHVVAVRETPDGWLVRADDDVHRAEPGETIATPVYVTRFGIPVPRAEVTATRLGPSNPEPGTEPPTGTPESAFTPRQPRPTGPAGRTTVEVSCADPATPRGFLDGQIYQLVLGIAGVEQIRLRQLRFDLVTALVFDAYEVPDTPTWFADVQPILKQYANLYPIMNERLVRLDDYESVRRHRAILQFSFSRDLTDPNTMPVTRDLSAAKRRMILKWLALADLPLGVAAPRPEAPARAPLPKPATALPDDIDPTDSKARFVASYLRTAGTSERTES